MADQPVESDEPNGVTSKSQMSSRHRLGSGLDRLRLPSLLGRYSARIVWAAFLFVNGFLTIGLLACVAMISGTRFVFPSLGPTAFLLFRDPLRPAASPRSALCGHAIGIICGYASLWSLGLAHDPSAAAAGIDAARVGCAALSLASTGTLMVLLGVWHPPAGATTLIIALGVIIQPYHLLIIEAAVAMLVLQALIINRLAGIAYPVWASAGRVQLPEPVTTELRPEHETPRRTKRCT